MTSDTKKNASALHPLTMLAQLGDAASTGEKASPDSELSAAFRQALGAKPGEAHLPGQSSASARLTAKQAKESRPNASPKSSPRQTQIGPRSGHR